MVSWALCILSCPICSIRKHWDDLSGVMMSFFGQFKTECTEWEDRLEDYYDDIHAPSTPAVLLQ